MDVQRVPLGAIDWKDESYRISEELSSPRMEASLRSIGQLNPAVLLQKSTGLVIVCGFRRLLALRRMGCPDALAKACMGLSPLETFRLAIFDNLAGRDFAPLEKARILFALKGPCGVTHNDLVEDYLPLLGLPAHKNVLRTYLALHVLNPDLRRQFNDGRLSLASVERLSLSSKEAQRRFASLLERVRLSASRQRELLDVAEELAAMNGSELGEVFSFAEVQSVLEDPRFSAFQKGERLYGVLYRRRNPRLSRAEEAFRLRTRQLRLPGAVSISPDPYFETPRLRIEFDVASAQGFRDIAAALREAAEAPVLEDLFRVD